MASLKDKSVGTFVQLRIMVLPNQTAFVISLLNAYILKVRIKKEESALSKFSFYQEHFAH